MSASSDISSLFKLFGGRADQYQEFSRDGSPRQRWPIVGGEKAGQSDAPELAAAQAEPEVLVEVTSEEAATPASTAEVSAWSSAGLQSLLAKLALDSQTEPVPAAVVEPVAATRPRLEHIRVVAVVSAKGGVGKSTLAANLAAALQRTGRPLLALDLDPQNALYHHFQPLDGQQVSTAGIAQLEQDWHDQGVPSSDGVVVLPYGQVSEQQRRAFESRLHDDPQWLAQHLSDLQLAEGALVIIDTPPGPSIYLQQALSVANVALVVSLADAASYTTLPMIDNLIETYTAERQDFFGAAYLINRVDHSRQLSRDITKIMQGLLEQKVLGLVHRDQSITEALAYNRNVLSYDPNGRGAHDILECAQALIQRLVSEARVEQPA